MTTTTVDPFDVATQAGNQLPVYYGRVDVTANFVVLQKGVGKLDYDESQHSTADRRTDVNFTINPIDATGSQFITQRDVIAESKAFRAILWPSLRKLGLNNVREANGLYAKFEFAKTGRTWQGRNGEVEETTLKFLAVYKTEAEAEADYYAQQGGADDDNDAPAMSVDMDNDPGPSGNGNGASNTVERETAKAFLPPLVKQANGDITMLTALLAGMDLVNKYFTIDSPEVQALLELA